MKVTRTFARRFRLLALLRGSFALGALADLAAAVALVLAPGAVAATLERAGIAAGTPRVLPWLLAVLLATLAALWLLAARDPRRYSGVVLTAIVGRLAGAAVLGSWAAARPELAELWIVAAAQAAFGLVHAVTWIPLRA